MEDFHSLLILMVIVWIMGKIFRMLTLPVLFGELLGGILVGPHILNLVDPGSFSIKILAELGIFFLMLHAGLETDPKALIKGSKKAILIALMGVAVPLIAGYLVSQNLGYPLIKSLFIGTAISATSIAISVRILKDCQIRNTKFANKVLNAALISDIVILVIFSALIKVAETGTFEITTITLLLIKILAFFAIVIIAGLKLGPYAKKFFRNKGFTLTLIIAMTLGYAAEWIGLHVIIGAFLAGLFISEELLDSKTFKKIEDRIYGLSYSFLAPIFFTTVAFNLDFVGIVEAPILFLILFTTAYMGKFVGVYFGGLIQNVKPKKAAYMGLVMNSRGAIDLIIISIGLQYRIIDQQIFSILIAVAFAATLLTIVLMRTLKKRVKFSYR